MDWIELFLGKLNVGNSEKVVFKISYKELVPYI